MGLLATARAALLRLAASLSWLPPLLARLAVGWVFVESGLGKVRNLEQVTEFFRSLGIPAAELQAPLAAWTELVCGALLLVGLLTRLASLPLVVVMVVAIVTAKKEELAQADPGFLALFSTLTGFTEFLYILLLVWLAVAGPGKVSLDALLVRLLPDRGAAAGPPQSDRPAA